MQRLEKRCTQFRYMMTTSYDVPICWCRQYFHKCLIGIISLVMKYVVTLPSLIVAFIHIVCRIAHC